MGSCQYIMLVGDGMADYPMRALGGRTPLEAAEHPALDVLCSQRGVLRVRTIPEGLPAGTETAMPLITGYTPKVPGPFLEIASLRIGGQMLMPILYWLLIAVLLYVVSKRTTFGRQVFAVGSSERTARLSGVNTAKVKRRVYVLIGTLVGFSAILQVARIGSMDYANAGSGYEMDAIAAVIVGGTSMSGGRGSIMGTVLGMLIIAVMNNLLNLMGVPPFLREAFKGLIVICAVLLQKKEKTN